MGRERPPWQNRKPKATDYAELHRPQPTRPHTLAFFALVVATLFGGWYLRGEEILTAEAGSGYALGIVGGAMMLLLLVYPLRKKVRFMRNWGEIKHWFRAHMILGVIGPVLVLFHCNFRIGSINSTVVLFATLAVARKRARGPLHLHEDPLRSLRPAAYAKGIKGGPHQQEEQPGLRAEVYA